MPWLLGPESPSAVAAGFTRLGKGSVPGSERMPAKQALYHPAHCLRKLLCAAKGALPHVALEMWRWRADQETSLYPAAVWWAVHPALVLADTLCNCCSSSFSHPTHHTVSPGPCVSGWDSLGLQSRRIGMLLINTFHISILWVERGVLADQELCFSAILATGDYYIALGVSMWA